PGFRGNATCCVSSPWPDRPWVWPHSTRRRELAGDRGTTRRRRRCRSAETLGRIPRGGSRATARERSRSRAGTRARVPCFWEAGATATIDGPLERDRATVRFGDVLHDRKAEAGAGKMTRIVGSPEAIEHPRSILGGDAGTTVADRDLAVRDGHVDGCARRAVLRRVIEKVRDRARDTDFHAVDRRRRRRHIESDLRIAEGHVIHNLVHDLVKLQLLEWHR